MLKELNDESELNVNVVVVIFDVDVMFTLDLSTPSEVVATVLGNVRVPFVLADVVNVKTVDILLKDVEFTSAVLLAVEGNCEMETWIRQLNTIKEKFRPTFHALNCTRRCYLRQEHADTSCSFHAAYSNSRLTAGRTMHLLNSAYNKKDT